MYAIADFHFDQYIEFMEFARQNVQHRNCLGMQLAIGKEERTSLGPI
jgi:hypothetical protein